MPQSAPNSHLSSHSVLLSQLHQLLDGLDGRDYTAPAPGGRGGVGPHVRHIVEHYECFFAGLDAGRIDYDRRLRQRALEVEVGAARERLAALVHAIEALGCQDGSRELFVLSEGDGLGAECQTRSTLGRELQFLASHTVHHFAILALLLRLRGIEPGESFGVAASTLRHESERPACAR